MNALHAFHFLRPWWLLALALVPLLPWLLRRGEAGSALRRLVDAALLPFLTEGGSVRRHGVSAAAMLAWSLAVLAMAGPTWQREPQAVYATRSAQVVVVSLSQRMLAADLGPDRMTRVRYKIHALLQTNKAGQNALVAYAGDAFTVAPLTSDAGALGELVNALSPEVMPVGGDDMAAAIRRATGLLKGAAMHAGSIVVIDDHADQDAVVAARAARAAGMHVSVLGVGTRKGAPFLQEGGGFARGVDGQTLMAHRDDASLRAVATAGGGRYIPMRADRDDVKAMARELPMHAGARDAGQKVTAWKDRGAWLLLPVLVLLALGFRRGVLLMLPLLVLSWWPAQARASGWQDAWHTRDQRAAKALADGHARKAQDLAASPALRGAAAYRAGDYRDAAKAFAEAGGAQNLYNRGNALARMHRYQDALKAYDDALAADPGLADARANRKAVRDWLDRQRKQHGPGHGEQHGGSGKGGSGASQSGQGKSRKNDSGSSGDTAPQQRKPSQDTPSSSEGKRAEDQQGSSGKDQASGKQGQATPRGDKNETGNTGDDKNASTPSPSDKQAQQRAREALKKRMDDQLGKNKPAGEKAYALGAQTQDKPGHGKPLPQAMREALERVPDDPGGLLRNKFMLEYQHRQQRDDGETQSGPDGRN